MFLFMEVKRQADTITGKEKTMKVFSLNAGTQNVAYYYKVWECLQGLELYFKKFNGAQYEEAMHLAFMRAISNQKEAYADPTAYLKKLARTEMRQRKYEIPCSVTDEETGEIARPYVRLAEGFNIYGAESEKRLKELLTDLYLMYPDDMLLLRPVFLNEKCDAVEGKTLGKQINKEVKQLLSAELAKIDGREGYKIIAQFYNELSQTTKTQQVMSGTKNIAFAPADYRCKARIPTDRQIRITSGRKEGLLVGIDTSTKIVMSDDVNLDSVNWVYANKGKTDIVKIDISPLMNYLYDMIYADKGVNTTMRRWLNNRYVLTTFGGQEHLNMNEDTFIDLCMEEILLNFVANNINNIIGFTVDTVYIKPSRSITYDKLRCTLSCGKIIDLDVNCRVSAQ